MFSWCTNQFIKPLLQNNKGKQQRSNSQSQQQHSTSAKKLSCSNLFPPATATVLGRIKWLESLPLITWQQQLILCVFWQSVVLLHSTSALFPNPRKIMHPLRQGRSQKLVFMFDEVSWMYCVNRTDDLSVWGPYNPQPKWKKQIHIYTQTDGLIIVFFQKICNNLITQELYLDSLFT